MIVCAKLLNEGREQGEPTVLVSFKYANPALTIFSAINEKQSKSKDMGAMRVCGCNDVITTFLDPFF